MTIKFLYQTPLSQRSDVARVGTLTVRLNGTTPLVLECLEHMSGPDALPKKPTTPREIAWSRRSRDKRGRDHLYGYCLKEAVRRAALCTEERISRAKVWRAVFVPEWIELYQWYEGKRRPFGKRLLPEVQTIHLRGEWPSTTSRKDFYPRYDNWTCLVPIEFDASELTVEKVLGLFQIAGYWSGIRSRPVHECVRTKDYGRFEVTVVRTENILPVRVKSMKVHLRGITPIIAHNWSCGAAQAMRVK